MLRISETLVAVLAGLLSYDDAAPEPRDWHSCGDGNTVTIISMPGIDGAGRCKGQPSAQGVVDSYVQTGEMYNGAPTWRGVRNGWLVFMCTGMPSGPPVMALAGDWMFTDPTAPTPAPVAPTEAPTTRGWSSRFWQNVEDLRGTTRAPMAECAAENVYWSECGIGSGCARGDRELESSCAGCRCAFGVGPHREKCCRSTMTPTPVPTEHPTILPPPGVLTWPPTSIPTATDEPTSIPTMETAR